jgi:NitT/TauT family transport system substrate-binding protein
MMRIFILPKFLLSPSDPQVVGQSRSAPSPLRGDGWGEGGATLSRDCNSSPKRVNNQETQAWAAPSLSRDRNPLTPTLLAALPPPEGRGSRPNSSQYRSLTSAVAAFALVATLSMITTSANAADRIRVAAQRTGILSWELDIVRHHGLDKKADLDINAVELASTEAGKIALKGGSADIMLSDWLWVARERSLGDKLVFYPASATVGAVMVGPNSTIRTISDLRGKKLAVAGGPLDKSWLLLQGLARRSGLDLRRQASIVYGAPPLLSEKQVQGEHDATLTFWNFAAELEFKGQRRAILMDDVMKQLGAKAQVAIIGYTFEEAWAAKNKAAVGRFIATLNQAKDMLASSDTEWQRLSSRIGLSDPKALAIFRQRYSEGIFRRNVADEEADARALYGVLAETGGTELVGSARELDRGTFYRLGM